jgi:hypothetical protein
VTTTVEPKKLAILVVLLLVAALTLYFNVFSGDSSAPAPVASAVPAPAASVAPQAQIPLPGSAQPTERRRTNEASAGGEFKPRMNYANPQDRPDPASIDPTLRLDLLAKVQQVEPDAVIRNIFQYGAAPPPPSAKPIDLPRNVPRIPVKIGPPLPPPPPGPPPVPQAPPMTFKYYGYKVSKSNGRKQAFLLDGDDIIIAGENDSVKAGRYRVVTIGVNSITIEDTQFKKTQTLPLQVTPA